MPDPLLANALLRVRRQKFGVSPTSRWNGERVRELVIGRYSMPVVGTASMTCLDFDIIGKNSSTGRMSLLCREGR
jgi:hypothetical protein